MDKQEAKDYIQFMAQEVLTLTDEQIDEMYALIDTDNDGEIDKSEMQIFLRVLMTLQENITFK